MTCLLGCNIFVPLSPWSSSGPPYSGQQAEFSAIVPSELWVRLALGASARIAECALSPGAVRHNPRAEPIAPGALAFALPEVGPIW